MSRAMLLIALLVMTGCGALRGEPGPAGKNGANGKDGAQGPAGAPGKDGAAGVMFDGARLHARWLSGDDGSKSPTGDWLDTMTGDPCTYSVAEDGETRCLPVAILPPKNGQAFVAWSDPACTKALLGFEMPNGSPPPAAPPDYAVLRVTDQPDTYVHHEAQAALTTFYLMPFGVCTGNPVSSQYAFWNAEVLPPSFFVSATIQ